MDGILFDRINFPWKVLGNIHVRYLFPNTPVHVGGLILLIKIEFKEKRSLSTCTCTCSKYHRLQYLILFKPVIILHFMLIKNLLRPFYQNVWQIYMRARCAPCTLPGGFSLHVCANKIFGTIIIITIIITIIIIIVTTIIIIVIKYYYYYYH